MFRIPLYWNARFFTQLLSRGSDIFWTKKTYLALSGNIQVSPIFRWVWKNKHMLKHIVSLWILLHGKINTRGLMFWKNFKVDVVNCVLCNKEIMEEWFHLFFECQFSKQGWSLIQIYRNTSRYSGYAITCQDSSWPYTNFLQGTNTWVAGTYGYKETNVFSKKKRISINGRRRCFWIWNS